MTPYIARLLLPLINGPDLIQARLTYVPIAYYDEVSHAPGPVEDR